MLILEHSIPLWLIATGAMLAMVLAGVSFWRYVKPGVLRGVLMLLRALFFIAMTGCLLLPASKTYLTRKLKPHFLVVVDTSRSMQQPARSDTPSRWDGAQRLLMQAWYDRVGADCNLDMYLFDSETLPRASGNDLDDVQPTGQSTCLNDALSGLVERYQGQDVAGCLLLSDGIDTQELGEGWADRGWPWPIYTVRLAPDAEADADQPDLRVDTIETARRVSVGWNSELRASVAGTGAPAQPVTVQLHENDILVQELPVQLGKAHATKEVVFQVNHQQIGTSVYRVTVPPLAGETHTNDNVYAVSVQVIDAKNRLLYVEGSPRWETKYLVRTLQSNPQVTPVCFIRGPDSAFMTVGQTGDVSPDMGADELARFRIVVLGNLDAEELTAERAADLVTFTETGGSLVLLGGTKSWGDKGFAQTPLGKLLPVVGWQPVPRQESVPVILTDDGLSHPAFAGDVEFWTALPPVLSYFPDGRVSPGAQTLVSVNGNDGTHPVIISRQYGQGKVTAILTDSLWRWQLSAVAGESKPYQRFWNQLLAWMSPTEQTSDADGIDVLLDRNELFLGDSVQISARPGRDDRERSGLVLSCRIAMPDGRKQSFAMAPQSVVTRTGTPSPGYAVRVDARVPGLHVVTVAVSIDGKERLSETVSYFVKPFTPESAPLPANAAVLKRLASSSKGAYVESPDALNRLLASFEFASREEDRVEFRCIWQNWWVLSCLIGLLCGEWMLRKWRDLP